MADMPCCLQTQVRISQLSTIWGCHSWSPEGNLGSHIQALFSVASKAFWHVVLCMGML